MIKRLENESGQKSGSPGFRETAVIAFMMILVTQVDAQTTSKRDAVQLGSIKQANEIMKHLEAHVVKAIPHDPKQSSYPEMFLSVLRHHIDAHPKARVLVLGPETRISGDLELDWEADWVRQNQILAVVCDGDLTVEGNVVNQSLWGGPMLFVAGDLRVHNLRKGGAPVIVLGDLLAPGGWVTGEYNDGVMRIGGDLEANVYLLSDHDGFVRGRVRARELHDELFQGKVQSWRELVVTEVLGEPDDPDSWIDMDRLWTRLLAGKPVLLD